MPAAPDPADVELGARIRELRGDRLRSEVAEVLGVDYDTLARWETGRQKPSLDNLRRIADALGAHVHLCEKPVSA